jgi:hypothetical protein
MLYVELENIVDMVIDNDDNASNYFFVGKLLMKGIPSIF